MNNITLINTRNLIFLLLAFTFPLSVPLSNILAVLLAVLILLEGSFSKKIQKINSSKWMRSVFILWVMYIISFFVFYILNNETFTDTFWLIKRISLLLLLPIFYSSSFSEKTIQKSVFSFLISMFLSSVIAIAENYEIINLNPNWTISAFLKYTDHNVFLAFSLIISFYSLFSIKLENKYREDVMQDQEKKIESLFQEIRKRGMTYYPSGYNSKPIHMLPPDILNQSSLHTEKEYDFKFENDKDKYIYNVVLDSGHVLIINDVKCVTLGHNYTDNNVIKHPYFGSQEIIKDLKKKYSDEWNNGLITLKKNSYIRNENTKLISNLV